jgi:hypothetical protein
MKAAQTTPAPRLDQIRLIFFQKINTNLAKRSNERKADKSTAGIKRNLKEGGNWDAPCASPRFLKVCL